MHVSKHRDNYEDSQCGNIDAGSIKSTFKASKREVERTTAYGRRQANAAGCLVGA